MRISLRLSIALALLSASLLWLSCAASTGFAATSSTNSFESAGVREELSHELQSPGPTIVSQGGSGGTGAAPAPAGTLVPSLSSAYSDTWSDPGRPLVKRIYTVPVNYKGSDGSWQAINDELISSPLGGYENAANSFTLRLPESLSSGVSLSDRAGAVSFSLQGAAATLPSVSGDTAIYREALASTDLSYVSLSGGVQELVTLKSTEAPSELRYSLSLPAGISPRSEADGSIVLVNGEGDVAFTIPAASAYLPAAGSDSARVLPTTVTASGSAWEITVDTGEAWLRQELASGPVTIDPTVDVSAAQACSLAQESPTTSKCSTSELRVGYDSTHQENHALLGFNVSEIPLGYEILNAKLGLYVTAHSTSTAKAVGVYRVTKPWTTSATWNTYDGTHSWTTAGGDYANPETDSDASVNTSVGASTGWYYWYPTKLVQEWVNTAKAPEYEKRPEGYANEGLIVKDQTDNATQNLLSIDSPWASSDLPYLEIYYRARGVGVEPQYTILSSQLTSSSTMGVNVASGDLLLQSQQLETPGIAGFGFSSSRAWNGRNGEQESYGHWADSNQGQLRLGEYPNGSVSYQSPTGALFSFEKQANGSFITPPGIKANMCAAGSPSPCPGSLPSGITHELIFDQSQDLIEYNSSGLGVKEEDRYKNAITIEYPSGSRGVLTDPQGHKIEQFDEGPNGYVDEIKDVAGSRHVSFSYKDFEEGEPELQSYTDAAGNTTSYEYSNYEISKITDPDGNVTLFHYDSNRRVTEIIRADESEHTKGPTTKFEYDEGSKVPSKCEGTPKATVVYDPDWTSSGKEEHETLYCVNVLDEVERSFNAKGSESKATFDPFGNQISSTAAARETGEHPGVTTDIYGTGGQNLDCAVTGTEKEQPSCPTTALTHGYAETAEYKDATFPYQPSEADSTRRKASTFCYWGDSCSGSGESPRDGELEQLSDPLSGENTLKYTYTSHGQVESSTDADGHTTSYKYESGTSANLKEVVPPSGSGLDKTTFEYDTDSRPHVITQCLNESCTSSEKSTITYNNDNWITEVVDTGPGATKTFKYKYDADGNLEKREDPTGTTEFWYDALDRLTKEELPGSATNEYGYDAASNLSAFTNSGGTTGYIYDGLNDLIAIEEPGGHCGGKEPSKCTTAEYDGDGSLKKVVYPSKASLTYTLDAMTGRPMTITVKNAAGTTVLTNAYTYTEAATTNDTPLIYKDVYTRGANESTTEYSYDNLDRLEKAKTTGSEPSLYKYALDGAGNRMSQIVNPTGSGESGSEGAVTSYFRYKPGNVLECWMKTNEGCTKSSSSEYTGYGYDGAGNETSITGYAESGNTTFSYNNLNQLKDLTPPAGTEEGVGYLGSGQSLLTELGSIALQNSALGVTKQITGSGTSYYARTPAGLLLDERLPGSTSYNPVYDAQGDVIGLLSTSGELVQTVRFGPYGENAKKTSGTVSYAETSDPFLFQGGYHLQGGDAGPEGKAESHIPNDLYHFGERYYEPTTGRWTQEDQVDQSGSDTQGDRYGFVGDDPVNSLDPLGTSIIGEIEEGAEGAVKWLGKGAERAGITTADLAFKAFGAYDAATVCVDTAGIGCLAAGESYLLADKIASRIFFRKSYLEK